MNFLYDFVKVVGADTVVQITAPEKDVVFEEVETLVGLVGKDQVLDNLVHVLVAALDF